MSSPGPAQCAVLYNTGDLVYLGAISSVIGLAVIGGQVTGGILANRIGHARYQIMAVFSLAAVFLGCKFGAPPPPSLLLPHVTIGHETFC